MHSPMGNYRVLDEFKSNGDSKWTEDILKEILRPNLQSRKQIAREAEPDVLPIVQGMRNSEKDGDDVAREAEVDVTEDAAREAEPNVVPIVQGTRRSEKDAVAEDNVCDRQALAEVVEKCCE